MLRTALVVLIASLSFACSKDPAATDAMRGGIPDDSIKPAAPPTGTTGRTGIPDDSIKPVAPVLKPAPTPAPTPTIARVGTNDDSIKPVVKPVLTPAPVTTPK